MPTVPLRINFALLVLQSPGWAGWIIQTIIHPAILILIPLVALLITITSVVIAFDDGNGERGLRAVAASLLPFLTSAFIFVYQGTVLARFASYGSTTGFASSLVIGFFLLFLLRLTRDVGSVIAAFCFATTFSVFVFSYAAGPDPRIFVLYYGFAVGVLLHLLIAGVPKSSRPSGPTSKGRTERGKD